MSVINVCCEEIYWGELLPGVCLIQIGDVVHDYVADNGVSISPGRFGLTFVGGNDPFLIFTEDPLPSVEDPDLEDLAVWSVYDDEIRGHYTDMIKFGELCEKGGYDYYSHFLGEWVSHRIHEFIKGNTPEMINPVIGQN